MNVIKNDVAVKLRGDVFSDHHESDIIEEVSSGENPFLSSSLFVKGYDILELIERSDPVEMLFFTT